jgi:putative transposase
MHIVALDPAFYKLYRQPIAELSRSAAERLRVVKGFEQLRQHGISATEAAAILGLSRATLYRWHQRLRRAGPRGLERASCRPHRVRRRSWPPELITCVETLRWRFPAWGKGTLTPLVQAEGFAVSQATVGRILHALVQRHRIVPAAVRRQRVRARRRMRRWHAQRLPRASSKPTVPGERIQIDTLHVCPAPGRWIKHFSASCPVSRWTVADIAERATSTAAARFLEKVLHECPFPVAAIQVDGGSEFMAAFEAACHQHRIALYVLPPKTPKLNGTVERMQQTWRGEFYDAYELPSTIAELKPLVQRFQTLYNTYRPHQGLHGCTPASYLQHVLPGVRLPLPVSKVLI